MWAIDAKSFLFAYATPGGKTLTALYPPADDGVPRVPKQYTKALAKSDTPADQYLPQGIKRKDLVLVLRRRALRLLLCADADGPAVPPAPSTVAQPTRRSSPLCCACLSISASPMPWEQPSSDYLSPGRRPRPPPAG